MNDPHVFRGCVLMMLMMMYSLIAYMLFISPYEVLCTTTRLLLSYRSSTSVIQQFLALRASRVVFQPVPGHAKA